MSVSPFATFDYSSFSFTTPWNDSGTGSGQRWSLAKIATVPAGFGVLSDIIYYEYINGGTGNIDAKYAIGKKILLCEVGTAAVKPASDFKLLKHLDTMYKCSLWLPICNDPDYIALGTAVGLGVNVKPVTPYYLVHKRFLRSLGTDTKIATDNDGVKTVLTLGPDYHCFAVGSEATVYAIRDWKAVRDCCNGKGTDCGTDLAIASASCKDAAEIYCSPEDVIPGGKCYDWTGNDRTAFDSLKTSYCSKNPTSKYCDCILADTREDYKTMVAANPYLASMSKPGCTYDPCKKADGDVLRTSDIYTLQAGTTCATNKTTIDAKVAADAAARAAGGTVAGGSAASGTGASTTPAAASSDSSELSTGAKIGISVGIIAIVIAIIAMMVGAARGRGSKHGGDDSFVPFEVANDAGALAHAVGETGETA